MEISFSYTNVLLSFAALAFIKLFFFNGDNSKKKKLPPSPLALPFIGHLYLFKNPLHHTLARISARYGPIVFLRLGSRPVLVVNSYPLAEECFTTHDIAFADRVQFPSKKSTTFNFGAIGTANYGQHWRNARRIATAELLGTNRLVASSAVRTEEVHSLARRLLLNWKKTTGAEGSEGSTFVRVEMKSRLFELSLNVIMRMISGKRYREEEALEESEEARRFREMVEEVFSMQGASTLSDFLPILKLFQGMNKKVKKLAAATEEFPRRLMEEHKRDKMKGEARKSLIGDMLSLQETDPENYNDRTIKSICLSLLLGGTDTTANSSEWGMALLVNHPHVLAKAAAEIEACVGNERLISESDLSNLPYLQSIVNETFRLYPGAPLLVPHESREDLVLNGYDIPRGTMLLVNAYCLHRDPATWDEPDEFKPERFLEKKGEEKYMLAFGRGRRRCPGEGLALREVGILLGTLVQCFEWKTAGDQAVDMGEGRGLTLPKAVALEAMYRPRGTMGRVLMGV